MIDLVILLSENSQKVAPPIFRENKPQQGAISQTKPVANTTLSTKHATTTQLPTKEPHQEIRECPKNQLVTTDIQKHKLSNFKQYIEGLQYSELESDRFRYFLFSEKIEPEKKFQFFQAFSNKNPDNKLALSQLLQICDSLHKCSEEIIHLAKSADPQNSAIWLAITRVRLQQQNTDSAVEALIQASELEDYSEYESEYSREYALTVRSYGLFDDFEFVMLLGNFSAARAIPAWSLITKFCNSESNPLEISDVCLRLGQHLSQSNKSAITNMIGFALQISALKKSHNMEQLKTTIQQKEAYRESLFNDDYFKSLRLINYDQDLLLLWMDEVVENGELSASKALVKEARLRSMDPAYNPCPANN